MISTTGASARYYNLLPEQNWEVDLIHLDSLIDENTAFIMICNPSNPTGTNWSKAHLKDIAALASRRRIVVLADEGKVTSSTSCGFPSLKSIPFDTISI